jgi:hypothetical protein
LGLVGFLRQPGNRVAWWLVDVGVAFGCDVALGDVFLPMAESHWGVTSSITATIGQYHAKRPASLKLTGRFSADRAGVTTALQRLFTYVSLPLPGMLLADESHVT